jgi:hypothetical protein
MAEPRGVFRLARLLVLQGFLVGGDGDDVHDGLLQRLRLSSLGLGCFGRQALLPSPRLLGPLPDALERHKVHSGSV